MRQLSPVRPSPLWNCKIPNLLGSGQKQEENICLPRVASAEKGRPGPCPPAQPLPLPTTRAPGRETGKADRAPEGGGSQRARPWGVSHPHAETQSLNALQHQLQEAEGTQRQ